MANAMLRKWVVADKRTWSVSWDDVPALSASTVDGRWGGQDIEDFYLSTPGVFSLKITHGHKTETFNVVFSDYSSAVNKRTGASDRWSVNVSLEQV